MLLALGCLRTGIVLDWYSQSGEPVDAEQLAAILPQLFSPASTTNWRAIFERLGSEAADEFRDVVFLSDDAVHVVQRLSASSDMALIAIADSGTSVGLVVASVRKKAAELEAR
jgi:hypothetical protein